MDEFTRAVEATLFASATSLTIEEIVEHVGDVGRLHQGGEVGAVIGAIIVLAIRGAVAGMVRTLEPDPASGSSSRTMRTTGQAKRRRNPRKRS